MMKIIGLVTSHPKLVAIGIVSHRRRPPGHVHIACVAVDRDGSATTGSYPKLIALEIVRHGRKIRTDSSSLTLPGHIHMARLAVHRDGADNVVPIAWSVIASHPKPVALGIVR